MTATDLTALIAEVEETAREPDYRYRLVDFDALAPRIVEALRWCQGEVERLREQLTPQSLLVAELAAAKADADRMQRRASSAATLLGTAHRKLAYLVRDYPGDKGFV